MRVFSSAFFVMALAAGGAEASSLLALDAGAAGERPSLVVLDAEAGRAGGSVTTLSGQADRPSVVALGAPAPVSAETTVAVAAREADAPAIDTATYTLRGPLDPFARERPAPQALAAR